MPALVDAGYDALGVDPHAPEGPSFRQARSRRSRASSTPSSPGGCSTTCGRSTRRLDRLAALGRLLLVDEFAKELIDAAAQDWYEGQYRLLAAAGAEPPGPPSLDEWRERHPDLHAEDVLLEALRARYEERAFERVPYLHRWLGGPSSEALEQTLTAVGAFPAIGWRWAGIRRERR